MRARVIRALRPLDAIAVENLVGLGTPDINITLGWIELKAEDAWPKRENTPLRLKRFTPQQRIFLRRRDTFGRAWILLRVGREWVLLRGIHADLLGNATRTQLLNHSECSWADNPTDQDLLRAFHDSAAKPR